MSLMLPICLWCAEFTSTVERLCVVRLANEEKYFYCHSSIAPPQLSFEACLVEDPDICRETFWRIEFSCAPCEEDSDAQESGEKWILETARGT